MIAVPPDETDGWMPRLPYCRAGDTHPPDRWLEFAGIREAGCLWLGSRVDRVLLFKLVLQVFASVWSAPPGGQRLLAVLL
jgi:hypothetical protein